MAFLTLAFYINIVFCSASFETFDFYNYFETFKHILKILLKSGCNKGSPPVK